MSRPFHFLIVLSILLLFQAPPTTPTPGEVHWGYDGEVGPEHWGSLSPEFAACSMGKEQSPVDIPASAQVNPPALRFDYRPSQLNIENNGHTIQVKYEPGSILETGGATYPLVQFHLHALSEHTLNGTHTALELHLVHKDSSGHVAVVGVMAVEGEHNPAYEAILAYMPDEEGESKIISDTSLNAGELLPSEQSYYHYNGSLTTPPCTEGVKWFVLTTPVELSTAQIAAFQRLYDHNYRPVLPLNERSFLLTSAPAPSALPDTEGTGGVTGPVIGILIGTFLLAVILLGAFFQRRKSST